MSRATSASRKSRTPRVLIEIRFHRFQVERPVGQSCKNTKLYGTEQCLRPLKGESELHDAI
jgi:hypothetical protein